MPPGVAVIRVMPNAPALVGRATATKDARERVTAVLAILGDTVEVQMDVLQQKLEATA